MNTVKTKLQKRRAAAGVSTTSFGVGVMSQEEVTRTPYLVSLSGDPLLHLKVKVYIPPASTLRIGRGKKMTTADSVCDNDNDLQLEGLGIEDNHCSIRHCEEFGQVLLIVEPNAVCYVNGARVSKAMEGEEEEMCQIVLNGGDRVILGICSHVFAFIDPRRTLQEIQCKRTGTRDAIQGSCLSEVKSSIATQEGMTSHDQAIREVILGRVETLREKEVRLATMVSLYDALIYASLIFNFHFFRFRICGQHLLAAVSLRIDWWSH